MPDLYPTRRLIERLDEYGTSWAEVVADLNSAVTCGPVIGSETRRQVHGEKWSGYCEPANLGPNDDAYLVVGVRPREMASPTLASHVVGEDTKRPRSSRRGGSGRRWPTTWPELLTTLRSHSGVEVRKGKNHLVVYKGGVQVDALPVTSSDHRALLNACQQLKRSGIDVSRGNAIGMLSFVLGAGPVYTYLTETPWIPFIAQ